MKLTLAVFLVIVCVKDILCAVASDDDTNSLSGRSFDAKSMLTSLAGNIMSRGFISFPGTATVLLKALIFAAGSLGAGAWKGGYARSGDGEEKILSDEEILLYLGYLTGGPGDNGCLQSVACKQPQEGKRYATAAEMLLKTAKMLNLQPEVKYSYILQELQEAADWGSAGGNCDRFFCGLDQKKYN